MRASYISQYIYTFYAIWLILIRMPGYVSTYLVHYLILFEPMSGVVCLYWNMRIMFWVVWRTRVANRDCKSDVGIRWTRRGWDLSSFFFFVFSRDTSHLRFTHSFVATKMRVRVWIVGASFFVVVWHSVWLIGVKLLWMGFVNILLHNISKRSLAVVVGVMQLLNL